mgnify:CR=1 FL=1
MFLQQLLGRAGVLCLLLVMAGCSIYSAPGSQPAPIEPAPKPTVPQTPTAPQPPRPPQPSTSSAWRPLVDKAEQARGRGDYEQSLALLERAQRIDPESSEIYLQLAKTHKARGDASQARATAERGMLYCSGSAQCDPLRAFTR